MSGRMYSAARQKEVVADACATSNRGAARRHGLSRQTVIRWRANVDKPAKRQPLWQPLEAYLRVHGMADCETLCKVIGRWRRDLSTQLCFLVRQGKLRRIVVGAKHARHTMYALPEVRS